MQRPLPKGEVPPSAMERDREHNCLLCRCCWGMRTTWPSTCGPWAASLPSCSWACPSSQVPSGKLAFRDTHTEGLGGTCARPKGCSHLAHLSPAGWQVTGCTWHMLERRPACMRLNHTMRWQPAVEQSSPAHCAGHALRVRGHSSASPACVHCGAAVSNQACISSRARPRGLHSTPHSHMKCACGLTQCRCTGASWHNLLVRIVEL